MAGDRPVNHSAEERAYAKGVEMADIKADLAAHGLHLDKINGSQEKTALELHKVSECLEEILGDLKSRNAVEQARAEDLKAKLASQVTSRQFFFACAGLACVLVGMFLGAR